MERARKLLDAASRRSPKQEAKNRRTIEATHIWYRNENARIHTPPVWMETEARVVECHHEHSTPKRLSPRVTEDNDGVIVSFTYYAHAQIYYDKIISSVEREQGEVFSVYYNALNPRQNTTTPSEFTKGRSLSIIGILGFLLLLIPFLAMVPE
jgi:hypothetical protein